MAALGLLGLLGLLALRVLMVRTAQTAQAHTKWPWPLVLLAPKPSGLPLWSALPVLMVLPAQQVQTAPPGRKACPVPMVQRARKATQALLVLIAPCQAPLVQTAQAHTR